MKQGILTLSELTKFIELLKTSYKVFAPVKKEEGVFFEEVNSADDIALGYYNSKLPPKRLFLPQCEVLCTFENGQLVEIPIADEKCAIFGMRSCDALALSRIDMVFDKEDLKDPYYLARRKNTVLLSLVCDKPLDTCFCTSVGGGPSSGDGSDIRMVHLGNRLLLEALTEKGESLISSAKQFLKKPKQSDLEEKEKIVAESEKKVPRIKVDGIKENLEKGFNLPLWSAIAERCLGCGVCTYLCPTCYCFDITDEVKGEKGKRIRTWDSCQYPLFTLHASGHNPRPSKTERMRQRIMHKFFYAVENFGRTFCVGCGRCVRSCPVNLDLRESIELITGNKACVSTRK